MPCKVAIVGACGLVGRELINILSDRSFPLSNLRLFDSEYGAGTRLLFGEEELLVEELSEHALKEGHFKFVFFTGGTVMAEHFAPIAAETGAIVIDNSSHFRNDPKIPLIVPEINGDSLKGYQGIIASPNCSTTQLALALHPIHQLSPIKRVVMSSYQAVSGSGFFGIEELERQVSEIEDGKEATLHYFPKQIAYNIFPQVDVFGCDGWTKEEKRILQEVRKIFNTPSLDLAATCVRVPVLRGHSESVMIETEADLSLDQIVDAWEEFSSLSVYKGEEYPTPWDMEGTIDTGVGRLRKDISRPGCYHFWCVADNLLRGSAFNAVHIAEIML